MRYSSTHLSFIVLFHYDDVLQLTGDFVKTYTQVHPKIPMKKVYLGRRMFRTSEDGSCSLLLRVQDSKAFLWLDLFEGDSLAATIKSTGKTFSPLGCTSESVLFSDIVQITYVTDFH